MSHPKRTQEDLAEFWETDPIHLSGCLNASRAAGTKLLAKVINAVPGMPLDPFIKKDRTNKAKHHPLWIAFDGKWKNYEIYPNFVPSREKKEEATA